MTVNTAAVAVCDLCLVRVECLEAGMSEPDGIWGGLSATGRSKLRKARLVRSGGAPAA